MPDDLVSVRYMVVDVDAAIAFYTTHFGFTLRSSAAPAFADVVRGNLRLLLRIHLIVEDLAAEVERLRRAGLSFRNDMVKGPGGRQILLDDPAGNPIELFQPATAG